MLVKDALYPMVSLLAHTNNLIVRCGPGFFNKGKLNGAILEMIANRPINKDELLSRLKEIENIDLLGINIKAQDEDTVLIELYLRMEEIKCWC